jgi:hypothetical protein
MTRGGLLHRDGSPATQEEFDEFLL